MKGLRLKNGVMFVKWGRLSTYRYTEREGWEVSPVMYQVVEWDMRTEPPGAYELLTEGEIRALDSFDALSALHKKTCELLGWEFE